MDLLDKKKIEKLSFEEAFERLNKVVDLMEDDNVSLDDSIEYYEIGILLKNHCEVKKIKKCRNQDKKIIDNKKTLMNKEFNSVENYLRNFSHEV